MLKAKDRGKLFKAVREKWLITYKGTTRRLTDDLSSETMYIGRQWGNIFKVAKEKCCQP